MNDLKHTVEDAVSLPSPHLVDAGSAAEPATEGPGVDIEALEYYRRLHGRHTLWARITLLTVIVGMLGANMWLTQRNYATLIVNMDQSRLAQAEMIDRQEAHIANLEARLASIELTQDAVLVAQAD